jgi:hypothetical protein
MLYTFRKKLRQNFKKRTRAYFRNNLALKTNLAYTSHRLYSSLMSKISPGAEDRRLAKNIHEKGVGIIGVSEITELEKIITEIFSTIEAKNGYAEIPLSKKPLLAPHVYRVLMENKGPIEAFFGSHFQLNWFHCQKIVPGYLPPTTSFGYHTDDTPPTVMKIFIYITDTYKNNGAFRAFDYQITDDLIEKGMLSSSSLTEREQAQSLITPELEEKLTIIEGKKGTVFLFDNNLIHKGTLPKEGMRIHIPVEIFPSSKPLTLEDVQNGCEQQPTEYYPKNPFKPVK